MDKEKLREEFQKHWTVRQCEKLGEGAAFEIFIEGFKLGQTKKEEIKKSKEYKLGSVAQLEE